MTTSKSTRIAVTAGAAVLCMGTGVSAFACPPNAGPDGGATTATAHVSTLHAKPTLAQRKAWVEKYATNAEAGLSAFAAKVAADPNLSTAKQAELTTAIDKAKDAMATLETDAAAATTDAALKTAVGNAFSAVHSAFAAVRAEDAARAKAKEQAKEQAEQQAKAAQLAKAKAMRAQLVKASEKHMVTDPKDRALFAHEAALRNGDRGFFVHRGCWGMGDRNQDQNRNGSDAQQAAWVGKHRAGRDFGGHWGSHHHDGGQNH